MKNQKANDYVCFINSMLKSFQIIAAVFVLISIGSCKKCYQCAIYNNLDPVEVTRYPLEIAEICGSKKDIKAYEQFCEDLVVSEMDASASDSLDLYCDCSHDLVVE
jgi:hypothetical protein